MSPDGGREYYSGNLLMISDETLSIICERKFGVVVLSIDRVDISLHDGSIRIQKGKELNKKYLKTLFSALKPGSGTYSSPYKSKTSHYNLNSVIVKDESIYAILESNSSMTPENGGLTRYMGHSIVIMAFDNENGNIWNQAIPRRVTFNTGIIPKWAPLRSSGLIMDDELHIITPEQINTNYKLVGRSLNLKDGTYDGFKDLVPVNSSIIYDAHVYCDTDKGRVYYTSEFSGLFLVSQTNAHLRVFR